jgi:hypothetical protein
MNQVIRPRPIGQVLGSGTRWSAGTTSSACDGPALSPAEVIARLEEAGAALLAMPSRGYTTHMRQMRFDIVHTALEAYGWETQALRPSPPSAATITAMDEAFGWLRFIPDDSYVIRRILGARALVHPLTARNLFTWRRLAATLGADHKSVQRWHGNGVGMIVTSLRRGRGA